MSTPRTTPSRLAAGAPAAPARRRQAVRRRLDVCGRVQGVGFRPFVYRLASELHLGGFVGNDAQGAFIEVEGPPLAIEAFVARLPAEAPPLARIDRVGASDLPPTGETTFGIRPSRRAGRPEAAISPDVATCADCLRELNDPADRRHRYPFISCTNCGPRYSIITAVPYDRPKTTMAAFTMCPACRAEYENPADRRFHAQPNACPVCGPRLWLAEPDGAEVGGDAIALAAERLADGQIVAVKGLGGFHLACRADRDEPVARLRRRKGREAKPLAVMVPSLAAARELARIGPAAEAVLAGPQRPIVLLPPRPGTRLSRHVAPGAPRVGLLLPYTPLHHLLLAAGPGALVMTSGNPTAEPLCADNAEALERMGDIADAFLLHDRDIARRVDDSVVLAVEDEHEATVVPIRRARGYVPDAIAVPVEAIEPVLAVGGHLKSAICILRGRQAVMSEHLGELDNPAAYRNFVATVQQFQKLLRVTPPAVACDLHPGYAATRYARRLGLPVQAVQHHHAHVAACMAEHGLTGPVVGIACDGTGYGPDGQVWGGEVLVADAAGFRRAAHLRYFALLGGDAAAIETWRPAVALVQQAFGSDWPADAERAFDGVDRRALDVARRRLTGGGRLVQTSSLGRLFDAAAFLLGLCESNRCEAQAAMALEAAAEAAGPGGEELPYEIIEPADGGPAQIDASGLIRALVDVRARGGDVPAAARAFHETVAAMFADATVRAAQAAGLRNVCLTGGCMANAVFLASLRRRLRRAGLNVYVHERVPPGDGGLALGQAVVAAERMRRD